MMQIPNLPVYQQIPQQPSYNAVKIDVHNPMVNVPAPTAPIPQYEAPTMPIYNYPQAVTQPYYMPPQITAPAATIPVVVPPTVSQAPTTQTPETQPVVTIPITPAPVAKEIPLQPAVVPPAPVVTEVPKEEKVEVTETPKPEERAQVEERHVDVVEPEEIKPQVDLNEFIAKLTNPDYDVQAAAMEDIANMVNDEPQKATELLDTKIVDALTNIIKADTSALEGPTAETEAARQAITSDPNKANEEKFAALEATITPKEKAERNKSYAMYTAAIMQKLYGNEVEKLTNSTVPLTELPGAVTIVEQLKNNPNPTVRTSAIEALSYVQNPAYKKDLETIFTIAQNDVDSSVQEAAKAALAKLNELPEPAKEVALNPEPQEVRQAA